MAAVLRPHMHTRMQTLTRTRTYNMCKTHLLVCYSYDADWTQTQRACPLELFDWLSFCCAVGQRLRVDFNTHNQTSPTRRSPSEPVEWRAIATAAEEMSTDRPAAAPPSWDDNADEMLVEGMVTAVVALVVLALVSSPLVAPDSCHTRGRGPPTRRSP